MGKKSIEIIGTTHLRGPNMWAYPPAIEALVDIGDLEDFPSNKIPGFPERLEAWLPTLIEHRCSYDERGGFLRRLREGTWPVHIMEHDALELQTLAGMAGALPALGIVACVLGVVKTMGAIDQPPPVLGALIGGALVGTFLGVFFAYGLVEPLANRLKQIIDDEGEIYKVVKQIIIGTMHGHPPPLIIEGARVSISHHNQPSFAEVFDGLRGK